MLASHRIEQQPVDDRAHPALDDGEGKPLEDVAGITNLIDDLPEEIQRDGKHFTALPFRIAVTYTYQV